MTVSSFFRRPLFCTSALILTISESFASDVSISIIVSNHLVRLRKVYFRELAILSASRGLIALKTFSMGHLWYQQTITIKHF